MTDLGNGKYLISNNKTGESKIVGADELPHYGLSAPKVAPVQQNLSQTQGAPAKPAQSPMDALANIFFPAGKEFAQKEGKLITGGGNDFVPQHTLPELQQARGNLGKSAQLALGDTASELGGMVKPAVEAASYIPTAGGNILSRLGLGAVQGGMQTAAAGKTKPSDYAGSAAIAGILNAIIPGVSKMTSKAIGKTAYGSGGAALPDIIREVGPIMNPKNMYAKTAPIRQSIVDLLAQSPQGMTKEEVFGKGVSSGTREGGLVADLLRNVGFNDEPAVNKYIGNKMSNVDQLERSMGTLNQAHIPDTHQIDLPVWQEFMRKVGNEVPQKNWLQTLMQPATAEESAAKSLRTGVRQKIGEKVSNPKEYERLNKLLAGSAKIGQSMKSGGNQSASILKNLGLLGLPIGGISSLLTGNPLPLLLGSVGGIASNPHAATGLVSAMENPLADIMRSIPQHAIVGNKNQL